MRHPLIEGLLNYLPEPDAQWDPENIKVWAGAAASIGGLLYGDDVLKEVRLAIEHEIAARAIRAPVPWSNEA